ncbi:unnamed protein product [Mesocestoides corti]|nr:unnamed protein product [Mesocestoides corti]
MRTLFQPELRQFQLAFEETVAEAVEAGPGSTIAIVYAGQVLHSSGEWILADSTFSGEQLKIWLDSETASTWQPEIQKLMAAPTGERPIQINICTPSAGLKTCWPTAKANYVMLSKSRRVAVQLQTEASWRANGILLAGHQPTTSYEALLAFSTEMADLHWEHHSKSHKPLVEGDYKLVQKSFKPAPPALYLLPSGPGGVQPQACGLFVVEGVNVLLGSAFSTTRPPQWWELVKSLDRLDAVLFPDWSAASIQSYKFLERYIVNAVSTSYCASWLGCYFTPPPGDPETESPLLLTPPTLQEFGGPQRHHQLPPATISGDRLPDKTSLFYKIGVGELVLQPLGLNVGLLLIWKPSSAKAKPLRLFLPASNVVESTARGSLVGVVRMLRKVADVCPAEVSHKPQTAKPLTRTTKSAAETSAKPANGVIKHVPPTTVTKPTPPRLAPTKATPPKQTPPSKVPTKSTPPARLSASANTRPMSSKLTPQSRPGTATSRLSNSSQQCSSAPSVPKPRTTVATASPHGPQATHVSKKPTEPVPAKRSTPSKTEAKLSAHAAKVTKTLATKPGHEIMYSVAGRPSNLPPRRKVGEKTVMEELNEVPEAKTLATDIPVDASKPAMPFEDQTHPDRPHDEDIVHHFGDVEALSPSGISETNLSEAEKPDGGAAQSLSDIQSKKLPSQDREQHIDFLKSPEAKPGSEDVKSPSQAEKLQHFPPCLGLSSSPKGMGDFTPELEKLTPQGVELSKSSEISHFSPEPPKALGDGHHIPTHEYGYTNPIENDALHTPESRQFEAPGIEVDHSKVHELDDSPKLEHSSVDFSYSKMPENSDVHSPNGHYSAELEALKVVHGTPGNAESPKFPADEHFGEAFPKDDQFSPIPPFKCDSENMKSGEAELQKPSYVGDSLENLGDFGDSTADQILPKESAAADFAIPTTLTNVPCSETEYPNTPDVETLSVDQQSGEVPEIKKPFEDVNEHSNVFGMSQSPEIALSPVEVNFEHHETTAMSSEPTFDKSGALIQSSPETDSLASPCVEPLEVHKTTEPLKSDSFTLDNSSLQNVVHSTVDSGVVATDDFAISTTLTNVPYTETECPDTPDVEALSVDHQSGEVPEIKRPFEGVNEHSNVFGMSQSPEPALSPVEVNFEHHETTAMSSEPTFDKSGALSQLSPDTDSLASPCVEPPEVHKTTEALESDSFTLDKSGLQSVVYSAVDSGVVESPDSSHQSARGISKSSEPVADNDEISNSLDFHQEATFTMAQDDKERELFMGETAPASPPVQKPSEVILPVSPDHTDPTDMEFEESSTKVQFPVDLKFSPCVEQHESFGLPKSPHSAATPEALEHANSPDNVESPSSQVGISESRDTGFSKLVDVDFPVSPKNEQLEDSEIIGPHEAIGKFNSKSPCTAHSPVGMDFSTSPTPQAFEMPQPEAGAGLSGSCELTGSPTHADFDKSVEVADVSEVSPADPKFSTCAVSQSIEPDAAVPVKLSDEEKVESLTFSDSSKPDCTGPSESAKASSMAADAEEDFPVHEVNVGGFNAIEEVVDRVDSTECTPEDMPPIHAETLYQLQAKCVGQKADSTTDEDVLKSPHVGFMENLTDQPPISEERLISPSSEASNDSVIHAGSPPPPGFIPDLVSSSKESEAHSGEELPMATSPVSTGFSSQHPLLFNPRQTVELPANSFGDSALLAHTPEELSNPFGDNCGKNVDEFGGHGFEASPREPGYSSDVSPCKESAPCGHVGEFANGHDTQGGGSESKSAAFAGEPVDSITFDPLSSWGHPQGMPAPSSLGGLKSTPPHLRPGTAINGTRRPTAAASLKMSSSPATTKAPDSLPPGAPIYLDVVWVPGYIVSVPFEMAAQFFTQVRARVYVLSGECLHPITGEALIAGVTKWPLEERETVGRGGGTGSLQGLNVVPTDEPLEWVRWLRTSSGTSSSPGTGEERLQAAGLKVHPSATLCDIHFSDKGMEVNCPGTQLLI